MERDPITSRQPEIDRDALARAIDELRVPLTIILGRTQLLRRRIQGGRVTEVQGCVETLANIEWEAANLEGRLRALEEAMQE